MSFLPEIVHSGLNHRPRECLSRILHRQSSQQSAGRLRALIGVCHSVSQTCSPPMPYVQRLGSCRTAALPVRRRQPRTCYMNRLIAMRARTAETGLCYVSEYIFIFDVGRRSSAARALQRPIRTDLRCARAPPRTPYGPPQTAYDVPCAGRRRAGRGIRDCISR